MKREIQLPNKKITLVLTAHVSQQSVQDVLDTYQQIQPDAIAIELDERRLYTIQHKEDTEKIELFQVIKEKKTALMVINYIVSQFQKAMAKQTGTQPGQEMRTAIQLADDNQLPLILIDRDVQITFKRIWSYLSLSEKAKLLAILLEMVFDETEIDETQIEALKQSELLSGALHEVQQKLPTISQILVDERDRYMAQKLKEADGKNILAVIGAAHGEGIIRHLQNETIDLSQLEQIKKPSYLSKLLKWSFPILLILLVIKTIGVAEVGFWLLYVALASAIGALICLSHPITILVAFIFAPLSTLSPFLAVGWFVGLSEAYFRKPTVADFNQLNQDVKSVKRILKNNILRTLLVMIVTSLLSSLVTIFYSLNALLHLFP